MNRENWEITTKEPREIFRISAGLITDLEKEGMPKIRRGI